MRIPGYAYDLPSGRRGLDCVVKQLTLDKGVMSAGGPFVSSSPDRVGDIVEIGGIEVANHRANPVVLWDHGLRFDKPIGKTEDPSGNYTVQLMPEQGIGFATTFFSQKLLEAEQIYHLIDEGIIRAQSIGFRPIKSEAMQENGRFVGYRHSLVELVEDSWTPIPCNGDAVRATLSKDKLCGKAIADVVRKSLEPWAEIGRAWAPGWSVTKDGKFDESKHPRADDGKFGSGGGGGSNKPAGGEKPNESAAKETSKEGSADTTPPKSKRETLAKLAALGKAAAHQVGHVEHAVVEGVKKGVDKLPGPLRSVVVGLAKVYFGSFIVAQKAATAVAKEKGLSQEQADKVAKICCVADMIGGGKLLPMALGATGLGAFALAGTFVPVGSLGYLGVSAVKNPMATYRAAKKGVKAAMQKVGLSKADEKGAKAKVVMAAMADRLKAFGDDAVGFDRWMASFLVAMDETKGSLVRSFKLADAVVGAGNKRLPTVKVSWYVR